MSNDYTREIQDGAFTITESHLLSPMQIDFTKVKTVDDVVAVLRAWRITVYDDGHDRFNSIRPFLIPVM